MVLTKPRSSPPCRMHAAHCIVPMLVRAEARALYDQVREAYNPVQRQGAAWLPPMKDLDNIAGICEDPFCRFVRPFFIGVGRLSFKELEMSR